MNGDNEEAATCNCRGGVANCPVEGQCQVSGVVYKASITEEVSGKTKIYIGMTGRPFKERWSRHKSFFKHKPEKRKIDKFTPSLYTHIWNLQDQQQDYSIKWEIIDKGGTYSPVYKKCMVCIKEKYHIMYNKEDKLNKRNEIFSKCRHIDQKRLSKPG